MEPAIGLEVPALSQHFAPLATVSELSLGSTVDIIGIVTEVSDLYTTTPYENNKEVWGRRITLVDESNGKVVNIQRVQIFWKKCDCSLGHCVVFGTTSHQLLYRKVESGGCHCQCQNYRCERGHDPGG